MAAFVRHFRISPADYWALDPDEHSALLRLMNDEIRERKKQAQRARRRR